MGNVRMNLVLLSVGCILTNGCHSVPGKKDASKEENPADKKNTAAAPEDSSGADVGFLLSMKYGEAKALSPQSLELPPYYKVAADEITVVSTKSDGTPRKVRAKGHVFLQIDYREELIGLGQEALIGGGEVILRGRPLLRRGRSVVEGLADRTVFYIDGVRLQVIGLHRITSESGVTPAWRGSWKDGPNPLLPALSPGDIPKEMRASPLLPPPSKDDLPKGKTR
ncbi:MAG: hypothetical protein K8R87_03865 [Verrucomicrobia bacterium]|nr:hypothetical protein [Verrucomicrobiota bacterium]